MAVTKIKVIRKTLKKAIDYIIDPDKTQNGQLVSSYGCGIGSADIEMNMTAQKGREEREEGNRIAYHLIQSFPPDEDITPEKAHEVGVEYAKRLLGGRYEFVISTHVDKDHLHNHIIFNATDYIRYNKYHLDNSEKERIRNENDRICLENNLSIIEETSGLRGKSKYEYEKSKAGDSWKDKLKIAIDEAIQKASSMEEFLFFMESEGYEIKKGKYIAFRAIGQKTFTRAKRIGSFYTQSMIADRIINKEKYRAEKTENAKNTEERTNAFRPKTSIKTIQLKPQKVNLIVDLSKSIKAQESEAYGRAVIRSNMNNLIKTMNFLIKHNFRTADQLEKRINEVTAFLNDNSQSIQNLEDRMAALSEKIKFTQNYFNYGKIARQAKREPVGSEFLKEHDQEIVIFHAAEIYMNRNGIDVKKLDLKNMFEEYKQLKLKKDLLNKERKPIQRQLKELHIIQANVESTLQIKLQTETAEKKEQERKKEQDRGL